jgi:hypothetical protein
MITGLQTSFRRTRHRRERGIGTDVFLLSHKLKMLTNQLDLFVDSCGIRWIAILHRVAVTMVNIYLQLVSAIGSQCA